MGPSCIATQCPDGGRSGWGCYARHQNEWAPPLSFSPVEGEKNYLCKPDGQENRTGDLLSRLTSRSTRSTKKVACPLSHPLFPIGAVAYVSLTASSANNSLTLFSLSRSRTNEMIVVCCASDKTPRVQPRNLLSTSTDDIRFFGCPLG